MHTVPSMSLRVFGLILLGTAILASAPAGAAPGALDSGFGSGGIVTTTLTSGLAKAHAVALQRDGKIVVVGESCGTNCDFLVERFNGDGSLDKTFDTTGAATTDFNGNNDFAYAVAVTLAGKIVVAGYSCTISRCYLLMVRYLSDGSYDFTFGSNGFVFSDLQSSDARDYALALQSDGKILVAGYTFNSTSGNNDFSLARYNGDGSPDIGFGFGGIATTGFGTNEDQINALAVAPDGKIVAAGTSCAVVGLSCEFALARYTTNGIPDGTLMGSGKVTTPIGSGDDEAFALALQPDAAIILAGQSCTAGGSSCVFALARYNTDGTLDQAFNSMGSNPGTVTTPIGSTVAVATSVALQPDGKILAAGYDYGGSNNDYALARYNADGTPDTNFGSGGIVTTDNANSGDKANAVALQPDGKIVAAGESNGLSSGAVSLVRYIAEPWDLTPDPFSFTDVTNVDVGSQQTSDLITISGLGTGIEVPVTVLSGTYAKNGSTTYTAGLGWAKNGDQFNVQHTASSLSGQSTSTALIVGGLVATDNATVTLGTITSATFTSTTKPGTSGGGDLGPLALAVFLAAFIAGRYRRRQSIPPSRPAAWPRRN